MDGDFSTESIELDGVTVVVIRGEVDASTAPILHAACSRAAQTTQTVVLDMSGVSFMDSAGLRVLIDVSSREGTTLVVHEPSPQVRRLLEITGLAADFIEPLAPAAWRRRSQEGMTGYWGDDESDEAAPSTAVPEGG